MSIEVSPRNADMPITEEGMRRTERNACVPAWRLQSLITALLAKGVITQSDIDAAAGKAAEPQPSDGA